MSAASSPITASSSNGGGGGAFAQQENVYNADSEYTEETVRSNDNNFVGVPRNFVDLINSICFRVHQFTTADLLVHGIRFVTILLFASILLPYYLFHILLFVLIIILSLVYIVGKNAFKADKANVPVDKRRLAAFRNDSASRLRHRSRMTAAASSAVHV